MAPCLQNIYKTKVLFYVQYNVFIPVHVLNYFSIKKKTGLDDLEKTFMCMYMYFRLGWNFNTFKIIHVYKVKVLLFC